MNDPSFDPERRRQNFDTSEKFYNFKYTIGKINQLNELSVKDFGNVVDQDITRGIEKDMVNSPPHYCNREMEAIDIIEMIIEIEPNPKVAYNMSNVLKYLLRFRDKGNEIHDLNKAVWYLNRMINKIKEEEKK